MNWTIGIPAEGLTPVLAHVLSHIKPQQPYASPLNTSSLKPVTPRPSPLDQGENNIRLEGTKVYIPFIDKIRLSPVEGSLVIEAENFDRTESNGVTQLTKNAGEGIGVINNKGIGRIQGESLGSRHVQPFASLRLKEVTALHTLNQRHGRKRIRG